jgi:hypothetical protein
LKSANLLVNFYRTVWSANIRFSHLFSLAACRVSRPSSQKSILCRCSMSSSSSSSSTSGATSADNDEAADQLADALEAKLSLDPSKKNLKKIAEWIEQSNDILVLTGAGVVSLFVLSFSKPSLENVRLSCIVPSFEDESSKQQD